MDVWQAAAIELKGSFAEAKGFHGYTFRIEAPIAGVPVVAECTGAEDATCTTVTAPSRASASRELEIVPRAALHGPEPPAAQVVSVDDAAFDRHCFVITDDESWARLWLGKRVRSAIAKVERYRFTLEDREVTAVREAAEHDRDALIDVIHAVSALSRGSRRLERAWKPLAKKLGGRCTRVGDVGVRLDVELEGVPITMELEPIDGAHCTRIRAAISGMRLAPFVLRADTSNDGGSHFTPETMRAIEALAPSEIRSSGGDIAVTFEGVMLRRSVALRALRLAAALARGPSRSGYR